MKPKFISIVSVVLLIAALLSSNVIAFASTSTPWPTLSTSSYCEYTATKKINVYKDTRCKTRGTSSPSKAYSAYISAGDVCYIYKITSNYVQINYPTASGRRTGYVKRGDIFNFSMPEYRCGPDARITTYVSPGGAKYGYTEDGDECYYVSWSSSYYGIIYEAHSGKRAYKFGWVKDVDFNRAFWQYALEYQG